MPSPQSICTAKKKYCYSSRHIFETVGTAIPFSPSIGYIGPTAIHLLSTANNPARQPCLKLTEAPYVNKVVICIQVFFSFMPLFYNVSHRPSHLTTSISDFRQKDEEIFDNCKSLLGLWPKLWFCFFTVSEMAYTVSSGTLNPSVPYRTICFATRGQKIHISSSAVKSDEICSGRRRFADVFRRAFIAHAQTY